MLKRVCLLLLALAGIGIGCHGIAQQKYLVILQAGTSSHEGTARALHALLYATELKEAGYGVALVFDGAGTEWAQALADPQHRLYPAYQKLKQLGVVAAGECDPWRRARRP